MTTQVNTFSSGSVKWLPWNMQGRRAPAIPRRTCLMCGLQMFPKVYKGGSTESINEFKKRKFCDQFCCGNYVSYQQSKLPVRLCEVAGCGRRHAALGMCQYHYRRNRGNQKKEA